MVRYPSYKIEWCGLMNNESFFFDWLTLTWLMENLGYIVVFMLISIAILFLFPVLLGYDLTDEVKNQDVNDPLKKKESD